MLNSLPTIAEAAQQFRMGTICPLDLVEYCLDRIGRFEDRVHAWVFVDEAGARNEALRQTAAIRDGKDPGPLAGIPIGIKDIIDVAGWPTKAGSRLRAEHVAARDATLVSRLRSAGAIILGKTVTTEFACFDPPPTRNPWNLQRTPGGSSSGSAAAVALEMCMVAIGTQTGGSIIRPASYCGVVGLKPTFGQVPLDGVVPLSVHLDHAGPIARCVRDAAIVYAQLRDPGQILNSDDNRPRLQAIEQFFLDEASPQIQSATRAAIEMLQDAGSEDHTLRLPDSFSEVEACHKRIMAVDAAEYHRRQYVACPAAFGPHISNLIATGLDSAAVDYAAALRFQRCFQDEIERMFGRGSIAIMPATNTTAPTLETTGSPKFNSPWSFAGVPSITIPGGLADDGMPWGLQLVGPSNSEARLLRAAEWCEGRLGFELRTDALRSLSEASF